MRSFLALLLFLTLQAAWASDDLVLTDTQGKTHALADLRGKFVVVNFWATWCPPCQEEIPELTRFHDAHHARDAVVWGIHYGKIDPAKLAGFIDDAMISYPVFPMPATQRAPFGPIRGLPTTVLLAPDGSIVRTHLGLITHEILERYMRGWCESPPGTGSKVCQLQP